MVENTVSTRDAALRAVGRTVVNFQRLEHNLKLAARLGPLQGTVGRVQRDIEKRAERAASLTLGYAIQAWLRVCEGEPLATSYTPDLFDNTLQWTFTLGTDPEIHGVHAVELQDLLVTRNELIHGGLVRFGWDSPEECSQLVMRLDELNLSIGRQIEYVNSILTAYQSMCAEAVQYLQSEDAIRAIEGELREGDA